MDRRVLLEVLENQLQWVRRPRTPVMHSISTARCCVLSCFNGSGVRERRLWLGRPPGASTSPKGLQWVRRPRTPVMFAGFPQRSEPFPASMGPASENAGYDQAGRSEEISGEASMGPASENAGYEGDARIHMANFKRFDGSASENAGYAPLKVRTWPTLSSFNGSGVRERRL